MVKGKAEPLPVYRLLDTKEVCGDVLRTVNDPRAPEVLAGLYDRMLARANQLQYPAHRAPSARTCPCTTRSWKRFKLCSKEAT